MLLGIAVVIGLPQQGPGWTTIPVFLAMWALYLSIHSLGRIFYGFGWESMLLETGFIVGFLGSPEVAAAADPAVPALDAAAPGVRRRHDQDARRPVLARSDRDGPPPSDPAHARPAVPLGASETTLVAPQRDPRQPHRPARRDLGDLPAPADRLVRGLPDHRQPARPGGHRELRVAELADHLDRLLRDQRLLPALGRRRALPRLELAGGRGRRRARRSRPGREPTPVVAPADRGRVRVPRSPQLEAAGEPVLPPPADERLLQPFPSGQRLRGLRLDDREAPRGDHRGRRDRPSRGE